MEYENPCVGNILGATFCFNCRGMAQFFQTVAALRQYSGTVAVNNQGVIESKGRGAAVV